MKKHNKNKNTDTQACTLLLISMFLFIAFALAACSDLSNEEKENKEDSNDSLAFCDINHDDLTTEQKSCLNSCNDASTSCLNECEPSPAPGGDGECGSWIDESGPHYTPLEEQYNEYCACIELCEQTHWSCMIDTCNIAPCTDTTDSTA